MTSVERVPDTVSKSSLPADASAGSEPGQSSDCPRFEYGHALPVPVAVEGHKVAIYHSEGNNNIRPRGVRMPVQGRSNVDLTTRDGVTEVKSEILSKLFGTGDQWKFHFTKAEEKDGEWEHSAWHQAGDTPRSQAQLPGELFRAVMGVPCFEQKGPTSIMSPEAMPRCGVNSIQIIAWKMTGALGRDEEGDTISYPMSKQTVELEVQRSKFWTPDGTRYYDDETLDQGWPGTAKGLASTPTEWTVRGSDAGPVYDPFTAPA